ncbi:MAG: hypothetical protein OEZ09_05145 [Betaproteobacteria bacterium]|nr:hypothetical protein [Betaproteobacteria bacterium]MDH5577825.1 hypothetical protein [Betaproteobacteria bacterium]
MRKALIILVLLGAGAVLARYHVANQHYFPVSKLVSSDGYTFLLVQDRTAARDACGKANDRFLAPIKAACRQCTVAYARCERELHGLELQLLMGDAVPVHVVVAPGARLAMQGPPATLRRECEQMATQLVSAGARSAACVFPGTMRRP